MSSMFTVANEIRRCMDNNQVPPKDRERFAVLVVSRVVAYHLELPSSPVSNVNEFYSVRLLPEVNDVVSALNEELVIPVAFVAELIKKIWIMRYRMVFDPCDIIEVYQVFLTLINSDDRIYDQNYKDYLSDEINKNNVIIGSKWIKDAYVAARGSSCCAPTPSDVAQVPVSN